MSQTIEEYLSNLKKNMKDCDAATIRDALSDAEEYLRNALEGQDSSAINGVIEEYGTPEEIAAEYKIMEEHSSPGITITRSNQNRPWIGRFFGIFTDPRAWGGLLYMVISIITGGIYFGWAVTGISLSVSMIIMIFGIPLVAIIFLSFRGLALLEGRIVEGLLGVRMPKRPVFTRKDVTWKQKLKSIFGSKITWFSTIYMILQFPLGVLYFCLIITLIAVALALIAVPIFELGFHIPAIDFNGVQYFLPNWSMPLFVLAGVLLLTVNMHIAKGIGWLHGRLARALLVVD